MRLQTEHRFEVEDYYCMAETGVLRPGARVELLEGKIIDMSPKGPFHGGLVKRLGRIFNVKANGRWIVSSQDPLRLDNFSEPQPDIMLLKPSGDDYASRHPRADDVLLLIEVSDSTIDFDRDEKLPAYGKAGVREVWIVNLNELTVEDYREPHFAGYGGKTVLKAGATAVPLAFPDVAVSVGELVKR